MRKYAEHPKGFIPGKRVICGEYVRISVTKDDMKAVLRILADRSFVLSCTALIVLLGAARINSLPIMTYPCA